ncbi:MAG: methionyl-tRNA formyltransferase [Candidatus Peregrinibacteria bacterium]|nr:methionyl-tRNA formyltransferase [Candidatus Peregrinibacteria bacterium]
MKKYQVVFFGTSEFAIPALDALAKSPELSVKAVVSQPDMPVGRHQKLEPTPVKLYAQTINLPVLQPEKIRKNEDFYDLLKELEPDLFVVISYGQILPKKILDLPKYGCINIHGSLLPKYRGASPIQHALLNGDTTTGITFMKMNEKMDEGDMLVLKKYDILEDDTFETVYKKLAVLGGAMAPLVANDYLEGILTPIKQDSSKATTCGKIEKNDGYIHWNEQSAKEIQNRIRAYTPWPSCFTTWGGKRLKILSAKIGEAGTTLKPGTMRVIGDALQIGTKEGTILPLELQLEGKKSCDTKTFLNGNWEKILAQPELGS